MLTQDLRLSGLSWARAQLQASDAEDGLEVIEVPAEAALGGRWQGPSGSSATIQVRQGLP